MFRNITDALVAGLERKLPNAKPEDIVGYSVVKRLGRIKNKR
jgi:hypothetical protein